MTPALAFNGVDVRARGEMLSLTDMWRAAGEDPSKRPYEWARKEGADFIAHMEAVLNTPQERILSASRGRSGATYAHWQIALAYAKYLSPEFHAACNVIVRERMEGRHVAGLAPDLVEAIRRADGVGRANRHELSVLKGQVEVLTARLSDVGALINPALGNQVEFKPAVRVLDELKVPSKGRRSMVLKTTNRLLSYTAANNFPFRQEYGGRRLFHVDAISGWLAGEGARLIAEHIQNLGKQGRLHLVGRSV